MLMPIVGQIQSAVEVFTEWGVRGLDLTDLGSPEDLMVSLMWELVS